MDYTLILTIASIFVPVCATIIATIYTVENRVKAEHKPYLVLDNISNINEIDKRYYYIVLSGKNNNEKFSIDTPIQDNINVKIRIRNIGYGVATNARFYNLETGLKINGLQEVDSKIDQQLFTTFDLAADSERSVQATIPTKKKELGYVEDSIDTLCIYQDLNGNIYNFVFSINIKNGGGYSYYAYQPSSHSYKQLMKNYQKQTKKIFQDYYK